MLCNFQVLYVINLYFFLSFLMVVSEGYFTVIRTTKVDQVVTLVRKGEMSAGSSLGPR